MILTNLEIYNLKEGINALEQCELPIACSYYLITNKKLMQSSLDSFNEMYHIILDKFQIINEDGQYIIPAEDVDQANKEINELLDLTVDLNLYKTNINQLLSLNIQMQIIEQLYPILIIDEIKEG